MERFANTSEGRREVAFFDTWKHRRIGQRVSGTLFPNANRGLHLVLIHTRRCGLEDVSRHPDASHRLLFRVGGNRRNACVADSRGPIPLSRRSPSPPRYLDEPRRIRESRAGNFFPRLFSRRGNVADLEDFVFWTKSPFLRGVEDREESTLVQGNYVDEVKSYSRRGFQTRNLCRLFGLLFVIF